jgi:hypothetical protein
VEPPEQMFAADDVVRFLQSQEPGDRVWVSPFPSRSTAYHRLSNYLMRFDIEQAGGEHGNQLHRFNEFAGESGRSLVDWSNFNRTSFLRAANVRWIITSTDLNVDPADSLTIRQVHHGTAYVYEVRTVLPRAYLARDVVTTTDTMAAPETTCGKRLPISEMKGFSAMRNGYFRSNRRGGRPLARAVTT